MNRKAVLSLVPLIACTVLVACGPSQAELDATTTRAAAEVYATQTAEAPTPTPPPTAAPTDTPTLTPPPPTGTPEPTPTPTFVPKPVIRNLQFAASEDVAEFRSMNLVFDAGSESIFVSFDYANIPPDLRLRVELERDDVLILETDEAWDRGATGTAMFLLCDDPRLLAPGSYTVRLTLADLLLRGHFRISAIRGEPGAPLVFEDFDDNLYGWQSYRQDTSAAEIADGRLRVSQYAENYFSWSVIPLQFEDFDLSVDVRQEEGPGDGYYGVVFRGGTRGFYLFQTSVDGYVAVTRFAEGDYQRLVGPKWSGAIHRNEETNRLRVVALGGDFAFYVNDVLVATLTDDALNKGVIGLASGNYDTTGMVSSFDRLTMTLPLGAVEVIPTPIVTAAPRATAAPPQLPLLTTLQETLLRVHAIGGAMDRIYHSGEPEACVDFLNDFYGVINAPGYDVAGQSPQVEGAHALYREAIAIVVDKVSVIRDECEVGDGVVPKAEFDFARTAINEAGDRLSQAIHLLEEE